MDRHPADKAANFLAAILGDIRGRAALVVVGGLVCQMGLSYGYLFAPLQIAITDDLGWSRTAYATAAASRIPLTAIATVFIGFLIVRVGARTVLTAACLVSGITFALGTECSWMVLPEPTAKAYLQNPHQWRSMHRLPESQQATWSRPLKPVQRMETTS